MTFTESLAKVAYLKSDVELQPHQERAIDRLKRMGGILSYHGLGSGKTLTSIAGTQGLKTDVIVPAALRGNYKKEVEKFTKGHRPKIMSYEQALKEKPTHSEAIVIDEAHSLGRSDTKRSQELSERIKHYGTRILLTGTPIRNQPVEIAPLINAVRGDRALPTSEKAFNEKYVKEEVIHPSIIDRIFHGAKPGYTHKIKNEKDFARVVSGYVDYHPSNEGHFPSVSHEVVEAPMSDEQMKYYKFVLGKANPGLAWKIRSGLPPSKTESKQLNSFLSGARQISNSTKAFGGTGDSTKILRAVEELKKHSKKTPNFKALIYSNYLDSGVNTYAEHLEKAGIPHAIFDGTLNDKKRKQIVEDYNNGAIKALLVTGAGSQGIDLKGTKLVQLLEPHWNNPRLEQAMGRAIRYKSHSHLPANERHVHVQRFQSTLPKSFLQRILGQKEDGSVDQYLDMLSNDKEKLNNQFLDVLKRVGS